MPGPRTGHKANAIQPELPAVLRDRQLIPLADTRSLKREATISAEGGPCFDIIGVMGDTNENIMRVRTIRAVLMVNAGFTQQLAFMGTRKEAEYMTNLAIGNAMAPTDIRASGKSINTIDNVYYLLQMLRDAEDIKRVALMTGYYEMKRARQAWHFLLPKELPGREFELTLLSAQDQIKAARKVTCALMTATNGIQLRAYVRYRGAFNTVEDRLTGIKARAYGGERSNFERPEEQRQGK